MTWQENKGMNRLIRDFMCRGVVTCGVNATAAEIAQIMVDNDVSALIVVDERLNACGIVSKTDLIRFYGKDLSHIGAEEVMTPEIITVSPETLVREAVQIFLTRGVHQLVIVTEGGAHRRPVAIFTTADAVALMAGVTRPQSEGQVKCSECLRKLISINSQDGADATGQ